MTPDYGISVAGVYEPDGEQWKPIKGAGGTSPVDADTAFRKIEASYASNWFGTIAQEVFG